MTDHQLHAWLQRLVTGDEEAFEVVYAHTKNDVYRTVAFLVYDPQDIHEIVNEIYVKLWKSVHTYDPERQFRFWLHGLIVKQVQDWKRKIWRRLRLVDRQQTLEIEEPMPETESHVLQDETRQELLATVKQLSYKLRVVILLRYYHSYSLEEIATMLNIPVGTVKSRHHLALKELRKTYTNPIGGKVESPYVL
jgi:RNA polymerase sigma-70 factor, ECF subfamily